MTPAEVARARWVAQEIARDAERDVKAFDGRPFDGPTVAEYFGLLGAQILALANLVDRLLVEAHPLVIEPEEFPTVVVPPPPAVLAPETGR